jgi:hypothetical protein
MNREFPDFDYDIAPLIAQLPAGWVDNSWHNDTMPCAVLNGVDSLVLWFDWADPEMSEHAIHRISGDVKRFDLCDHEGVVWFQTDSWDEMRQWIEANSTRINNYVKEAA